MIDFSHRKRSTKLRHGPTPSRRGLLVETRARSKGRSGRTTHRTARVDDESLALVSLVPSSIPFHTAASGCLRATAAGRTRPSTRDTASHGDGSSLTPRRPKMPCLPLRVVVGASSSRDRAHPASTLFLTQLAVISRHAPSTASRSLSSITLGGGSTGGRQGKKHRVT